MASITCGKCRKTHQTVLAVKLCYDNGGVDLIKCGYCSGWPEADDITLHTPDELAWELISQAEQAEAELLAELHVERWYEERGAQWGPD